MMVNEAVKWKGKWKWIPSLLDIIGGKKRSQDGISGTQQSRVSLQFAFLFEYFLDMKLIRL